MTFSFMLLLQLVYGAKLEPYTPRTKPTILEDFYRRIDRKKKCQKKTANKLREFFKLII
jgi:hypothetical protein